MCDFSLQSFGDFQADSLKYCQAGECQVNETFERIESTLEYCGFKLYGGCEPISETLLGQVTEWKPTDESLTSTGME